MFAKAIRKSDFEMLGKSLVPGPGNYERMRMFDNKKVVDYSKISLRFKTLTDRSGSR